jgi:predicted nucleic acid-binding protein
VTAFVLDSSIALCWCFDDEATDATRELLDHLREDTAAVPNLWHLEIANVLALSERRRRITAAEIAQFIALLRTLDLEIDGEAAALAFARILDLAREERLTAYDAAYLELAMRLGVPLASKDRDLCDAAERLGVSVLRAD